MKTIQEELLEQYKDFLHFKAADYMKKGIDYNDVYNEGYLSLLENYLAYGLSPDTMRTKVDSHLRAYYRKELKERHISYGTNPENIFR